MQAPRATTLLVAALLLLFVGDAVHLPRAPGRQPGGPAARQAAAAAARTLDGVELFAVDDSPDPGSLLSQDRDTCSGCDFAINLRCESMRFGRYAPFHRVVDCLLPMYGMIQLAHAASTNRSARVCALTFQDGHGMDLHPFLKEMVGIQWHSLVDEVDSCAQGLRYHAGYRTAKLAAKKEYLDNFGKDRNLIRAYSIDVAANLHWMQRDAAALVGGQLSPLFIIIQRSEKSRAFHPGDLERLKGSMGQVQLGGSPLPLAVYNGTEGVADTVRMFAQAAEVLGYHGAAWANTLFSSRRHCMHQISTSEDLKGQKQWRTNSEVNVNPWGRMRIFNIPLRTMLEDNKVQVADFERADDKDHFIKGLEWVPLKNSDIARLKIEVRGCLRVWAEGHW